MPELDIEWGSPLKRSMIVLGVLLLIAVGVGTSCVSTYNTLVSLDQAVQSQWAQVENTYQRRLDLVPNLVDLVPNLVETVKGAAAFERTTFTALTEARSQAAKISAQLPPGGPTGSGALKQYQGA